MRFVNVFGEIEDLKVQPPTAQASNISYDGSSLSWTRGDGEYCLVVISAKRIRFQPFKNKTYPLNSFVDKNTRVIFRGDGNSVTINLMPGILYFVKVFEFNGKASTERYDLGTDTPIIPPVGTVWQWYSGNAVLWESGSEVELESA